MCGRRVVGFGSLVVLRLRSAGFRRCRFSGSGDFPNVMGSEWGFIDPSGVLRLFRFSVCIRFINS